MPTGNTMTSTADADQWVDAARRGEGGFDEIYRWLAGPVAAFARTRGASDPEGLANETFLRVFRSIDRFDGDGTALRSWVFSIARNLVIDGHRVAARRPTVVDAPVPERQVEGADTTALRHLAAGDLHELLGVLTDEQREVVVLRLVADLSLAETAAIVERPVTAVKRLQARALRTLQRTILDQGVSS